MLDKLNILTRIIEKIKRFPVTFESMKEWIRYENIEISDRTLYRYLKDTEDLCLNDGHITTFNGEYNKKTWKFEYDNSNNELNETDIYSLMFMSGLLPDAFFKSWKESIEKIERIIYKNQSKSKFEYHYQPYAKQQILLSSFGEQKYSQQDLMIINHALWSVLHQRKIKLFSSEEHLADIFWSEVMLPMQLIYHEGKCILMCLSEFDLALHAIDISTISEIETSNCTFDFNKYESLYVNKKNNRFGIEKNTDEKVYNIVLLFHDKIKEVYERNWHHSQNYKMLPDGKAEFRLHCGINNELIQWILKWEKNVEIIAPSLLLHKVREYASTLTCHYKAETMI
ncbi:MAG: WYL domain-containing protein [Arachidicoccus sp.]|nr:WYL domain-containing protein [Arachidicoccus sp.]